MDTDSTYGRALTALSNRRRILFLLAFILSSLITVHYLHLVQFSSSNTVSEPAIIVTGPSTVPTEPLTDPEIKAPEPEPTKLEPVFKPLPSYPPPISDNFPLAAQASSSASIPPIPSWNAPPRVHVRERTPLFIGFTRNWLLLQQCVVSYLTAGWPASDIYVIENTGTMAANARGHLSLQNPFYLDHKRLKDVFGVNVVRTPTLLTFSQLQNFYLSQSLEMGLEYYWWSHMDTLALSDEKYEADADTTVAEGEGTAGNAGYRSLYLRAVDVLRTATSPSSEEYPRPWAHIFFAYDRLTLVNATAYDTIGGWDPQIPFYMTDCDMYERIAMAGYAQPVANVGILPDVASTLPDLLTLYRRQPNTASSTPGGVSAPSDERGSAEWERLRDAVVAMDAAKQTQEGGRNTWQARQTGGKGEPYYRDPEGFQIALDFWIDRGREVFDIKWGHRGCDLRAAGRVSEEFAWRTVPEWEVLEKLEEEKKKKAEEEKEKEGEVQAKHD